MRRLQERVALVTGGSRKSPLGTPAGWREDAPELERDHLYAFRFRR
jgi:hypothetical protein